MKDVTGSKNICIAGGCGLNCTANGVLAEKIFDNIFIPPSPQDAGAALGAAILVAKKHKINSNSKLITLHILDRIIRQKILLIT